MSSKESSAFWEMDDPPLDAKEVYVVMQNDYRISRNIRAQWYFKNVNNNLTFKWKTCQEQCKDEIEVISAIPKCADKFEVDTSENTSTIRIVSDTKLHFLSTQYRLVFCLDLSSSVSTVDIQHDDIYYEEIFACLERSLKKVSEPFFVPGSEYYFVPQIYITVIAHIPNCAAAAPQVLIQGWILTYSNVQTLLDCLQNRLQLMCQVVKKVSSNIHEDQIQFMMPHNAAGSILDGTIDGNKMIKKVLDLSADTSTLNLIRYGILALQLLPENSSAGIVVITDGVLNFPNCKSLDSLLTQLRNSTIACSFLQLGSPFHSFSCFGRAPYKELMEFIATATCGAYFPSSKYFSIKNSINNEMNAYHKALLFWNFQKMKTSGFLEAYEPSSNKENYWHVDNPHFYSVAHQSRVKKKHTEGTLKVSLENLLSCRLREGYSVKSVIFDEGMNETVVRLVLPWMLSTNIEYLITSGPGRQWKNNSSDIPSCHFEVIVDGCYEFLHDVTCSDKKPIRSVYRKTVIAQFWSYIKNLSNTDQILTQLHSFSLNPIYYTIPESIKNGVPLFYFPSNTSMPMLSSKNLGNVNFTSFWKPLCMLDINVWQKWMHAHRIGVILQHDIPLQKNLHLPNLSGRYVHVQCRQATAALNSLLSEDCSFVLVENHSYIKLLFDDPDKPPVSFYVIRVTSKPPCVVIRLAFLGGLPGLQRYEIVNELREKILNLKLPKQSTTKDYSQSSSKQLLNSTDLHCCLILKKPVEKILIRYEKLPTNFLISVPDSQGNTRNIPFYQKNQDSFLYTDALATLSKYLLQQRWIWTLQYESYVSLDLKSASKILYALTNIRLQEGFHFSHSSFGIIYLVQEIPIEVPKEKSSTSGTVIEKETNCCIVQYIIFPPHTNTTVKDSISEEDDTEVTEADGELQLITECWIEPQHGSTAVPSKLEYLNGLKFNELPSAIHKKDLGIVKVLTTFEHLCTICERVKLSSQITTVQSVQDDISHPPTTLPSPVLENISSLSKNQQFDPTSTAIIPYAFSLMSLLPKCPQVEMVFSTLHEIQSDTLEREAASNNMFFEYFLESMKHFHDQEINLTLEDCAVFLHQIHHRERNEATDPEIRFPHPEYTFSSLHLQQTSLVDFSKCKNCSNLSSLGQFMDSIPGLSDSIKENIPKWKCFVKGYSSSHVTLTFVPATYGDLKKMYFPCSAVSPKIPDKMAEDSNIKNVPENKNDTSDVPDASMNENVDDTFISENSDDASINENSEADASMNDDAEADASINENAYVEDKKSFALPIYVYNCVSMPIINQLVQLQQHIKIIDTYKDYTFECECCSHNDSSGTLEQFNNSTNQEAETQDTPKKTVDVVLLNEYCSLLEKAFSRAFVYGVYRSLMLSLNVQKYDAIAAIDNICEESLLEIDITEFVFMICGHVKDFFTKRSFKQMHSSQENDNEKNDLQANAVDNTAQESLSEKSFFPMSMLQKYQPCEELHQKHLSIKKKFSEIIESFFKCISSRPDYYFFCPSMEEVEDVSLMNDGDFSQEEESLSENLPPFEGENFDTEVDKVSNFCEEDASTKSFFNTNSSVSSIDKDTEPSSLQERSTYPPLIVHFSCTVKKSKQEIKSCPLTCLPTCLNDIIKCLDADSNEISLEDLRITLDIYCLTVPNDVEHPEVLQHRVNSTSYSSNSPIPEAEIYQKHAIKDEENDSNCSDIPTDTLQGGSLANLPSFQRETVYRCIEKIQWLLQDEKASVALNCFPITSNTLDMVVNHVKSSKDRPCCLIKEISLMFVYGSENSLDKFTQAFKRMSPTGYRLEEVGDRYYLVTDTDAEPKCNLDASLEVSHFDILKKIPHSDDGAELKRIVEKIKDTPMFADNDFPFLNKPSDKKDDLRESEVENEVFTLGRDKRSQTLLPDEDSETEDGFQDRPKAKFRKTSVKRSSGKSQSKPSFWETERKSKAGRKDTAKKTLSYSRSISTGDDNEKEKLDNPVKEGSIGSEVLEILNLEQSSPDVSLETKSHQDPSTTSITKLKTSDSDDPTASYKDSDYENVNPSNTEDGYDGDSSDSGSDLDLMNSLEHTRRPVLPKFWLIMNICADKVIVYFHMRHRAEDDPEIIECKSILNEVVQIVNKICKEVNQILLLQSLYDTRMCDQLLVPEENEDLWKKNDPNRTSSNDDPECIVEVQEKYLEATLKFDPGAFGCPVVWVTHFRLHHRLNGNSTGPYKTNGMSSLRSVLNAFSVNNRENMFVYQENTGNVFYIRLSEMSCDIDHQRQDDDLSLTDHYSSMQSLPMKSAFTEFECETDFRPRVNSGASDGYRQDSISTTSSTRRNQKCVAMYLHGIGQVGFEIRNDFVRVLQNKLNEGVLDQINMMLARNPLCMLTPEDVLFIQNPNSPPVHELYYTLPVKQLGYAHALHIYLQQNLLHFLYNPKYTDSRKETHFKAYSHNPMEWCQVDDNDTFLHHTQHALGRSGGKGIACVVLSLVTGQNKPFQTLNNLPPNPNAYLDGLSETEFDDLTCTSPYTLKYDRSPGPVALVRFQLWHVGKDNIETIELNLKNAVKYALWDLILEYRVLTSPTSESSAIDDLACYSEPTTPIRVRRSGLVNVEASIQTKDIHSAKFQSLKEMSSSVPDITSKSQTSSPLLKDIPTFKDGNKPQSAKPEFISPSTSQIQPLSSSPLSKCDKGNLNLMFNTPIRNFFLFGEKIGIPTLNSTSLKFPSRHSTDFILKESIKIIKSTLRDLVPKVYIKTTDSLTGEVEFIPYDPDEHIHSSDYKEVQPGATKNFILIGRNERQWRTFMGLHELAKFQDMNMESVKSYQRHLHHVCEHPITETNAESNPSSPTFASKCSSSVISTSPNPKSSTPCSSDNKISKSPIFVPRQRVFLMYIEDKEAVLYLYNFTSDTTQTTFHNLTRLIKWHHLRNSLLSNIVLQKLGVFHGLSSLYRADFEKPINETAKDSNEPVPGTFGYVEQLIRHHTHINKEPQSSNTANKSTAASLKSACVVRSLKNFRPPVRFHLSSSGNVKDPVSVHGCQYLETITSQRKDMQVLYNMWQTRGSSVNYPFDRAFYDLKRLARLSHYCLTPILFHPSWRYKVAPIRDHALEPFEQNDKPIERQPELTTSNRSRHSSGSSLKSSDATGGIANIPRARRMSGAAGYPGSNQTSPKLRAKTPSEETWHTTVCHHYLQEYIQYLHTVGFVSLQTSETADKRRSVATEEDKLTRSDSFSRHRNSVRGAQTHYLIKCLLGGLIVFELGLNDPYAFGNVYSLECMRFKGYGPRKLSNQFTPAFLDELDKIKMNMNLHSFTFDYHLRMIHNYVSGRQLIFKNGYHITSFLDDFIKYYRKPPGGARNALHQSDLLINEINMSGDQLYNYIISHNKLYNMTVLRMVPIIDNHMDTEYALVELSARKASYTDVNDVYQMGSFDVGVLINHNTSAAVELNSLKLTYYIILTSQRDLYPKLSQFGAPFGTFQPVKANTAPSSELSSRKTSTVSMITEKEKFESSGEESSQSVHSMDSSGSKSKKVSVVRGMCDEDVLYLGYYSSQESMMQVVLEQQSDVAAKHLTSFVHQANVHCRRDFLWSSLLPRSLKEDNNSRDHSFISSTSHDEFKELLRLVSIVPLNEIDGKLTPFMNMHISWYSTLAPVLKLKYADCHREFMSADNSSLYVMVTDSSCPDSFMLLKIDVRVNQAELCLVFREEPLTLENTEEKPNQRVLALQSLVEGFVNACCFHLWTCILPP